MNDTPTADPIAHVTDRTWEDMRDGATFTQWPDVLVPAVGTRVTIFDRNLDFTQHDVRVVDGLSVEIGPAIPWPREK